MSTLLLSTCICSLVSLGLQTSLSADTLKPSQTFVQGFTLISSNQRFEFGFFRPGNGLGGLYLGTWYHNLPLTVVWVANRNKPLRDSFGQVALDEKGALFLFNRSMGAVWSTDKIPTMDSFTPVLQLLDTGNLVIRDDGGNRTIFWESFDFPTDTLLPNLKLGWNLDGGVNRIIRSWKSIDDPSEGEYSFCLEPHEAPQLVLRSGSKKLFRRAPWDGSSFSGITSLTTNPLFQAAYIYNSVEVYFQYEMLDDSILSRFLILPSGLIQYFTWRVNSSKEWNLLVTINSDPCDNYGKCGNYGSCYTLSSCKLFSQYHKSNTMLFSFPRVGSWFS
ncbi:EGF-like domain-containing protein [Artemisia annua]|uniref:EGF-like domain-containing protein n=1 Tax=Artemisia annua TaxID=35608 RepID=A0A2U1NNI7_ARTAN|nr:EGF-like domain-containing protein [Artemisia annua]